MTKLLVKLFVKNSENTSDPSVRGAYGALSGFVGITTNILLSALKLVLGLLSGSLAIMADALNNLSDAGASVITLVSFRMSAKPADREHPFGHARIEYIASMAVSFLILLVGFEMISDSISSLISGGKPADTKIITLIMLGFAVVFKLWLAIFYHTVGKKIDSGTIKASGQDSLFDAISTFGVLVCSIIIKFTDWYILDAIVGIAVSILILVAGIRILNETKNNLLGEAPVEETVTGIKSIVDEYPEIIGIHDLMVHNYGPGHYIASFHAEVDGRRDIYLLHDKIDNVEKHIAEKLGILCTIHLDPILIGDPFVDELKAIATDAIGEICSDITLHDFRVVVGETHTNLIFDIVVPFEVEVKPSEIIKDIQEKIKAKNPTYFCVITVDKG